MADEKAKLLIEAELDDKALKEMRRDLEELAKESEQAFAKNRTAASRGGRLSPAAQAARAEMEGIAKRYQETQRKILKLEEEMERKSAPRTQRMAGFFHKLFFGEKVQTSQDADQEQRKVVNRLDGFNRNLAGTLALTSHLASTLGPLPGGGILHAATAGLAQGYGNAVQQYNENRDAAGEEGTVGGRAGAGFLGGLRTAITAAALMAMAKAVSGAVQGSRESENVGLALRQAAGGDAGLGADLYKVAGGTRGFTLAEAAPIVAGTARAGGGAGAAEAALRAEKVAGQGGAFNQMTSVLAQTGGKGIDENAKRLWIDINATAMAQGLQKGRIGELISGAMMVAAQRSAGVTSGDPTDILRMASGMGGAYKGRRGFETIGRLEGFTKGESSPLANAMALMANGLGSGSSYVQAKMGAEKGLFGAGAGPDALKKRIEMLSNMTGGNSEATQMLLSQSGGLGMTEAGDVLKMVQSGKFGQKEFEEYQAKADKTEQDAWNAMANAPWKGIDKTLEAINIQLGNILRALGGLKAIQDLLTWTLEKLTPGGLKGYKGTVVEGRDVAENSPEYQKYMQGKHVSLGPMGGFTMQNLLRKAVHDGVLSEEDKDAGRYTTGSHGMVDKQGKMHIIFELRDTQGNMLEMTEAEAVANSQAPRDPRRRKGASK